MLYEPRTSISITDLKALTDICSIEAKKFPAAPALYSNVRVEIWVGRDRYVHHVVDCAKFFDAAIRGPLQVIELANIHGSDTNHFGAWAHCCDILGDSLGLLDIATDDASISAEVHQGADLSTANGTCTTCAEDYLVICISRISKEVLVALKLAEMGCEWCRGSVTKDAIPPDIANVI